MARKPKEIVISESEYNQLLVMSQSSKLDKRYVDRAKIILLSKEKHTLDFIVEKTGLTRKVVNKWRNRFRSQGIEGLKDAPRPGKPARITAEQKAMVIQKACKKPSGGYNNWSQQRIAREVGISQGKVNQILKQAAMKPHKTEYWCGKSSDLEFKSKLINIVGLYMNPPENVIVLCVDEKTQMPALDRLRQGQAITYKRNGTVALIAALAVHTGKVTGQTVKSNKTDNFLKFLKKLDRVYHHKTLHIIVDNLSVHNMEKVKEWLKTKRKIKVHFTPTYASWLNQIEIWFNILSQDVPKGGIWKSSQQLISQTIDYIKTCNSIKTKPFKWMHNKYSATN
ncbi:IS630-like element ISRj1 family transposase [Fulvivirga kasyanovii]|uniref:IS630 family transposase n=1 Tax=Fulvivirga kasyanovii TaxID=396812 RepID=A0ABW9RTW9_9BACT|nr:IS630 family transposase [Fulvivirga kasyanovii]MTI27632.1 IS630 family transposase [Fulvivirga kasyanovii]